jgi:dTDP-4-dehydrorhamnose reductase
VPPLSKALVIGADGLLGSALVEALGPGRWAGTWAHREVRDMERFDLAEFSVDPTLADPLLEATLPDVVFCAAGMTVVEACEGDEHMARKVNSRAGRLLARACALRNVRFVFFSTDYVFDGTAGPYAEDAAPAPLTVFGRTKLEGETGTLAEGSRHLVIRTSWLFGPESRGDGLVYRLARALRAGRPVPVPADQYSTPTYSRDLAEAAIALAEFPASGVWHVAGPESMSAASFALLVAKRIGAPVTLVKPVPAAAGGHRAIRAPWGGLRTGKLREILPGLPLRAPAEAFAHWSGLQRGVPWPPPA